MLKNQGRLSDTLFPLYPEHPYIPVNLFVQIPFEIQFRFRQFSVIYSE